MPKLSIGDTSKLIELWLNDTASQRYGTIFLHESYLKPFFSRSRRGYLMSVVRCFPEQLMKVALKDIIIRRAFAVPAYSLYTLKLSSQIAAGTLVGILSLWMVYPLDLVATRLMSDVGQPRKFKGNMDCCATIVAQVLLLQLCRRLIFFLKGWRIWTILGLPCIGAWHRCPSRSAFWRL